MTWRSTPTVTDEEALRESEVALLLHALAKRVTPQQMEIIRLTMCFVKHGDAKAEAKKGLEAFEDMDN